MTNRLLCLPAVLLLAAGVLADASSGRAAPSQSDLDALMKDVLAHRDENWKKLHQYILEEREHIQVRGGSNVPVWGQRNDFSWFIQDGYFVRSPVRVDGVEVPEDERRRAEARFLRRAKARDERARRGSADGVVEPDEPRHGAGDVAAEPGAAGMGTLVQARQPQFIDSAYFLKFKFEQGRYAFVGREGFEGREVLRIEYYPERLFTHEQETQARREREQRSDRDEDFEAAIERMMNKVSLVTLWIEPSSKQIVKYTFDNVSLDFLPAAWLVRVSDLKAQMTMGEPFPGVWLPRDVEFYFAAMLAIGPFDVRYRLEYHDYREAKTSARIRGGRP